MGSYTFRVLGGAPMALGFAYPPPRAWCYMKARPTPGTSFKLFLGEHRAGPDATVPVEISESQRGA